MHFDGPPLVILLVLAAGQTALAVSVGLCLAGWLVRCRDAAASALRSPETSAAAEGAGPSPAELLARLEQEYTAAEARIEEQLAQLRLQAAEARTDGLTGLPNRKALDEDLERRLAEYERHRRPITLVLCDVDHFKAVNDQHGHLAGDALLRELAAVLRSGLRRCDFVARFGGEEFAMLLQETELSQALTHVKRLRTTIESHRCQFGAKALGITVSLGVAQAGRDDSRESLLRRADMALYAAKSAGRNCTRYHDGAICRAVRLRPDGRACLADDAETLQVVGEEIRERLQAIATAPPGK